jgi:hypothetical protein
MWLFSHGIVIGHNFDDAGVNCYTGCFFGFVLAVCRDGDGSR